MKGDVMKKTMEWMCFLIIIGIFVGCEGRSNEEIYVYGVVVNEVGSILETQERIQPSSGALFGNESVKFGDLTYILQIEIEDKLYTVSIISPCNSRLEALNLVIDEGTRIRIRRSSFYWGLAGNVSEVYVANIEVVDDLT
jgi:hypothetical protein